MTTRIYEPSKFTVTETDILWMLVAGKNILEMSVDLSLPEQKIQEIMETLKAKTGAADLTQYAVTQANNRRLKIL
jgi:DNA-binding NarL/FixJ family response regulator